MLKRIQIENFKSLANFSLPAVGEEPLGKFVCIVGLNGSGKSTLLQALDFLAQLMTGGMEEWLRARDWSKSDLVTKGSRKSLINFRVEIEGVLGVVVWAGSYNASLMRCTAEQLELSPSKHSNLDAVAMRLESGAVVLNGDRFPVNFEYQGSVFSRFILGPKHDNASMATSLLRVSLRGIKSLELLSPNLMRKPSREAVDVGFGGEHLAAFVHGLSFEGKEKLTTELKKFYPHLSSIASRSTKYGWKRLFITEAFDDEVETEARHVNDGLLRLLSIVAQTIAEPGVYKEMRSLRLSEKEKRDLGNLEHKWYQSVLLDEIENGINPELMEKLVKFLLGVDQQIILTTHSPLLLNYLTDDEARRSVFYLYRDSQGATQARRLFSISTMSEKLDFMGAGEAYADTELRELNKLVASAEDEEGQG